MTTVVNNQAPQGVTVPVIEREDSSGTGFFLGAVIIVVFLGIVLYFGIPAIKNMGPLQMNVPAPQVVLPDTIKVETTPTTPAQ